MAEVFDITIIGGGPAGLYTAYYAGFRGFKVKIIDSLEELGGQVSALYPEKNIYDVAGFPCVPGRDLVKGLVEQALQFKPTVCLGEKVTMLKANPDKSYTLTTTNARADHQSRVVIVTIGIGAFNPKRIPIPDAQTFEGRGLSYFVPDIKKYDKKNVLIVGGGDSAVDWALNLVPRAASVTLVHRRDGFRAHEESVKQLKSSPVNLKVFYEVKELRGNAHVQSAVIFDNRTKAEETIPVDEVLGCLGFEASAGPLAEWGLKLEGHDIPVTTRMETNLPGVYAAGDVATYPGKVKLIVCGFGEAAVAVNNAAAYLNPKASVFPGHSSSHSK